MNWNNGTQGMAKAMFEGKTLEVEFDPFDDESPRCGFMRWHDTGLHVEYTVDDRRWVLYDVRSDPDVARWRERRVPIEFTGTASVEPCCDGGSIVAIAMPAGVRVGTVFTYALKEVV